MLSKAEFHQPDVQVSIDDVLGPMGYKSKEDVGAALLQQILAEMERGGRALQPQFIVDIVPLKGTPAHPLVEQDHPADDEFLAKHLDGAFFVAASICTVGNGIDRLIDDCFARGDYLGAMVADIVGSRAVEELGEISSDFLCARAAERKVFPLCRISPGYGQWDVSGQRQVFSLLNPSPIGVSLNDFCMMQPKKSLSFLIPLGEAEPVHKLQPACRECTFKNCAYRRRR
jgi:hypothetical protein